MTFSWKQSTLQVIMCKHTAVVKCHSQSKGQDETIPPDNSGVTEFKDVVVLWQGVFWERHIYLCIMIGERSSTQKHSFRLSHTEPNEMLFHWWTVSSIPAHIYTNFISNSDVAHLNCMCAARHHRVQISSDMWIMWTLEYIWGILLQFLQVSFFFFFKRQK